MKKRQTPVNLVSRGNLSTHFSTFKFKLNDLIVVELKTKYMTFLLQKL